MKIAKPWLLICALVLHPSTAAAWLPVGYEDVTVVERSELILVGHLKADTITHEGGSVGVHRATLIVTQVLKGQYDRKELPLIIHYGLTPVVGGYLKEPGLMIDVRGGKEDHPKDIIEIYNTGSGAWGAPSLVEDARQDVLWFLRKRSGSYGREPGNGDYGIVDPQDLSRLEWKEYFLCYLSSDPADAVRKYAAEHPKAAPRAKKYLDHLEIQAISKIEDAKERFDKLFPFFVARTTWNMKSEAEEGILSCGKVGAEELRRLFDDPHYRQFRVTILDMWTKMGYRDAIPLVIELLKKHDQFWADQHLAKDWWNKDEESEQTRRRQAIYCEDCSCVYLLSKFPDPSTKEVLELTRNRWKSLDFENRQIVEECDLALQALSQEKVDPRPNSRD